MENFNRKNIDEFLEIHQICQYFHRQNFCAMQYSNSTLQGVVRPFGVRAFTKNPVSRLGIVLSVIFVSLYI